MSDPIRIVTPMNNATEINTRRLLRTGAAYGLDLRGADLSGLNLRFINFDGADLRWADLTGTTFFMCGFSGTRFDGCDVDETTIFAGCHFESENDSWLLEHADSTERYGFSWENHDRLVSDLRADLDRCVAEWGFLPPEAVETAPPAGATVLTGMAVDEVGYRLHHTY